MADLILIALALTLLGYTSVRAHLLSFTHDESSNYVLHALASVDDIVHYNIGYAPSNNHLLNTLLTKLFGAAFGQSDFVLRAPNVLAHLMYLMFSMVIVRRSKMLIVAISGFIVLNVNPFMLDYFSLARGYGLGLGFLLGSIYFCMRYAEQKNPSAWIPVAAVLFSTVACLSHFGFAHVHVAILAVLSIGILLKTRAGLDRRPGVRGFTVTAVRSGLPFILCALLSYALIAPPILKLRQLGDINSPGDWSGVAGPGPSFVRDTVVSLVYASLYGHSYEMVSIESIATVAVMGGVIAVAVMIGCVVGRVSARTAALAYSVIPITVLTVASIMIQASFFNIDFPKGRMALFLLPLASLVLFSVVHVLGAVSERPVVRVPGAILLVALAYLHLVHAEMSANLSYTWEAATYADVKQMLSDVATDVAASGAKGRPVTLSTPVFQASIVQFYKISRGLTWLDNPRPTLVEDSDYYFYAPWEQGDLQDRPLTILAQYAVSRRILAKSAHP